MPKWNRKTSTQEKKPSLKGAQFRTISAKTLKRAQKDAQGLRIPGVRILLPRGVSEESRLFAQQFGGNAIAERKAMKQGGPAAVEALRERQGPPPLQQLENLARQAKVWTGLLDLTRGGDASNKGLIKYGIITLNVNGKKYVLSPTPTGVFVERIAGKGPGNPQTVSVKDAQEYSRVLKAAAPFSGVVDKIRYLEKFPELRNRRFSVRIGKTTYTKNFADGKHFIMGPGKTEFGVYVSDLRVWDKVLTKLLQELNTDPGKKARKRAKKK